MRAYPCQLLRLRGLELTVLLNAPQGTRTIFCNGTQEMYTIKTLFMETKSVC